MRPAVVLPCLFGAHLVLTLCLLRPAVLFGGEPIAAFDYALHFGRAAATDQFLSEYQRCWGYNPYFMAGYPAGTVFDVNNHLIEVFVHVAGCLGMSLPTAFNLLVFLALLSAPVVTWLTARNFRLTPWQQVIAVVLAMLLWLLDTQVSLTWRIGVIASGMAMYWLPFSLSCLYRYWQDRTVLWALAFQATGVITSLVHPLSFLFFYGSVAGFILCYVRQFNWRFWGTVVLLAVLVLLANAFWIWPFLEHLHLKTASGYHWIGDRHALARDLVGVKFSGLRLLLYCLAGGCFLTWWRQGRREQVSFFFLPALALTLFGYVSGELALFRDLETYRNNLVVSFLLITPAAVFFASTLASLRTVPHWRALAFLALTLPMGVIACFCSYTGFSPYLEGRALAPLGQAEMDVIRWLKGSANREGRVAVERWQLGALVPWYTGAQVVGGPYPLVWLPHNFTNFACLREAGVPGGVRLFGRDLEAFSPEELDSYLAAYNVSLVIASTDDAKGYFGRQTKLKLVASHGPYSIYQKRSPDSFFLVGQGRVRAAYGRLHITEASAGDLILKYHWTHTLVAQPPQELTPVFVLDDPVPFIKVSANHCRDFVIQDGSRGSPLLGYAASPGQTNQVAARPQPKPTGPAEGLGHEEQVR